MSGDSRGAGTDAARAARAAAFDPAAGSLLERLVFGHRAFVLLVTALISLLLGGQALQLPVNASFEKMIPASHPYVRHARAHEEALRGLGQSVRIVVEPAEGDIYDPGYLATLRRVTDAAYLVPGVDRAWMRGLWTPAVRWTEVTEEGWRGGPVMPGDFDGSPAAIEALKANVARAGLVGSLVAEDLRASAILVPLIERDPHTRAPLDYAALAAALEREVRGLETPGTRIRMVGFAIVVGDLIAGLGRILGFFALSVLMAGACVWAFTRDLRGTLLLVAVALLGVVWLLGLMRLLGQSLDPFSALVPFLVFAIGLSHGAQKMNGVLQDVGRGMDRLAAARRTFRRLFRAGLAALLANVVGFAVLMTIDIPAIRELALTTSLGTGVLVWTKLVLIPVLLSVLGVSPSAARRAVRREGLEGGARVAGATLSWTAWERLTQPRLALPVVIGAVVLGLAAAVVGLRVGVGDMDPGAPELRADSRYNRDLAAINAAFGLSSDPFVAMLESSRGACMDAAALDAVDRYGAALREVEGVQAVVSVADGVRFATAGQFEGNPKWLTLPRNASVRGTAADQVRVDRPELVDPACVVTPVIAYLADHRAETLARVVAAAEAQAHAADHRPESNDAGPRRWLLAGGSAGIEAATNDVVRAANPRMLALLYAAVALLALVTFRSWRAMVVALVPLLITSALCEALMVALGIGIKVATLPVIALGVGVGVDYALYLVSVQLAAQRRGLPVRDAVRESLARTGRVVALIGLTMAAGVATWVASPIRFQADMGLLLAFMFLWNMVGALVLVPALSGLLLRGRHGPRRNTSGFPPSEDRHGAHSPPCG